MLVTCRERSVMNSTVWFVFIHLSEKVKDVDNNQKQLNCDLYVRLIEFKMHLI